MKHPLPHKKVRRKEGVEVWPQQEEGRVVLAQVQEGEHWL